MRKIFTIIALTCIALTTLNAQTIKEHKLKPEGIYKTIDVEKHNKIISILNGKNTKSRQEAVDSILKNPNIYIPPVLYALSKELFNQGKKDEAAFWFYTAQLRARYDANLCLDETAKGGLSILNDSYGPEINKYAFKNIDKLKGIVTNVVTFVKNNDENYDHRWINLHGMDAIMNKKTEELSQPQDKWHEIKAKTIDDYYTGFTNYLKTIGK